RRPEPIDISELAPGGFVFRFGQPKIPGNKSNRLPHSGKFAVRTADLKKLCVAVPQVTNRCALQLGSFAIKFPSQIASAGQLRDGLDGEGVAIHVAVDGGAYVPGGA